MSKLQGFWSYVHADDQTEGARITRLANDVAGQFEIMTGEPLDLFLDKDAIQWGEFWRDKIDSSLASVAFFVPVMTPRYFMSAECRRELQFFIRQSARLGVKELVLPLHYVDVRALSEEAAESDDLISLVREFQWEDWRDLRFVDMAAESYRRGVGRLASRLVEANRLSEKADLTAITLTAGDASSEDPDSSPGFLDQMATAEEVMPRLKETIEAIGQDIELIGKVVQQAAGDMQSGDKQAPGFAARLVVARRLARQLGDPVERVWSFGNEFASQFHKVDEGIRVIIVRSAEEAEKNSASKKAACSFFDAVRTLSDKTRLGLNSVEGMVKSIGPIEGMSKDLRPVLRRLRQGLTTMLEAREISDEWIQLIDASGVDCEERVNEPV